MSKTKRGSEIGAWDAFPNNTPVIFKNKKDMYSLISLLYVFPQQHIGSVMVHIFISFVYYWKFYIWKMYKGYCLLYMLIKYLLNCSELQNFNKNIEK